MTLESKGRGTMIDGWNVALTPALDQTQYATPLNMVKIPGPSYDSTNDLRKSHEEYAANRTRKLLCPQNVLIRSTSQKNSPEKEICKKSHVKKVGGFGSSPHRTSSQQSSNNSGKQQKPRFRSIIDMNSQFLDKNAYGKFTASKRRSLQCLPPLRSKVEL